MKIIHMIPRDGLGGVEQAARSLMPDVDLDIETVFVCGKALSNKKHIKVVGEKNTLNSLKFYCFGLKYLFNKKPDILICSLWRISFLGILYFLYMKVFSARKIKLIIFIHSNNYKHFADRLITQTAIFFSDEVWCDSQASKDAIFPKSKDANKIKVISFYVPLTDKQNLLMSHRENNFVYWGRLAKQKRLDRAIRFFKDVESILPNAFFYIYGPDDGDLDSCQALVKELKLTNNVFFMGKKPPNEFPEEILSAKFFINTSSREGMAITIVEAMQLGLVPIVTPVGEIGKYCTDGLNSIYYNDLAISRVKELIEDDSLYSMTSHNAFNYWNEKIDYSKDFNENCRRLVSAS